MSDIIDLKNVSKVFRVHQKRPGLMGSLISVVNRQYVHKKALDDIDFKVGPGEMVGLIGANGAGKTTLVKILSGIIHCPDGHVRVMGLDPWDRNDNYRRNMSLIMGQKAQLWWDLPALDSYLLLKEIYQIDNTTYKKNLEELSETLNVQSLLTTPVRKLSLGERMKVELVAALLHNPRIVYLDEPTIGLDIMAQKAVRNFLKEYQKRRQTTILLTSHYMKDIEELCPRVALMKNGQIIFDGAIEKLQGFGQQQKIKFQVSPEQIDQANVLSEKLKQRQLVKNWTFAEDQYTYDILDHHTSQILTELTQDLKIQQIETGECEIEEIVENYLTEPTLKP